MTPKVDEYTWFGWDTVASLRDQLDAAGEGSRLEVRVDSKKNMTLRVVGSGVTTQDASGDLNKSFICPPICP